MSTCPRVFFVQISRRDFLLAVIKSETNHGNLPENLIAGCCIET